MAINKEEIRKYFNDRVNIAIFVILALLCIYALVVRFTNLGTLSFWGDDGMTFLGTQGVLEHGLPQLPSGNVMYHTFLHFYTRAIPALLFGLNEFALRFPSALFGVLVIPLVYLFVKELSNRYVAVVAAVITSFSMWQIEFSREARYYSEYQFLYLLSIYLFYKGYFKDEKKFRVWALICILLSALTTELGYTLIFLFVPLLLFKKFKGFFKKDILIALGIVILIIVALLVHRALFWKAGVGFYETNVSSDIANPVLKLLSKFFAPYIPFYHRIYGVLFPQMYKIVFWGIFIILPYIFLPWIRNNDEHWINIYQAKKRLINSGGDVFGDFKGASGTIDNIAGTDRSNTGGNAGNISGNSDYSIKLPFNLIFLYFIFYSNTVFNGVGFMTTQQRYIYQVHPMFIAIYCYLVFDIGRILWVIIAQVINGIKDKNKSHQATASIAATTSTAAITASIPLKVPDYIKYVFYFAAAAIILSLTLNWVNPVANFKVISRQNGDEVISEFAPSNTFSFHHDAKTPGEYIFQNKKPGDIVIATDLFNPFGYTRQMDYWLWTGGFAQWQPYVYKDGKMYEEFFDAPLIRDLYQLYKVLNNNADKNIWLITSNSMRVPTHISPDVSEFIFSQKQNLKITGKDGICQVYLFEKTDKTTRGYFFKPEDKNILKLQPVDFPTVIGFGNKDNKDYLKYGWSGIEPQGTWADRLYSILFLKFNERLDYKMTLNVQSLYDPDQPQEMEVIFNNDIIGKIQFIDSKPVQTVLDIPAEIVNTGEGSYNTLEFNYKYLLSPLSLGVSSDARTLSVFFQKIAIEKSSKE
jgi:4-amino-4-deoxy-L-arabinose transferase-like glycosyltransferase